MPLSKDDFQLYFLLGLIGVFAVLSFQVFLPYIFYILGGIILVYINYPLYRNLKKYLRNEAVTATITILLLLIVTVLPTIFLIGTTVTQAQGLIEQVGSSAPAYIDTTIIEAQIQQLTGEEIDLNALIHDTARQIGEQFSSEIPSLIQTLADVVIGLFVMGFTMYYLFKDGDKTVRSTLNLMPLRDTHKENLLQEADSMAEAILIGHLLTAAVQAIITGIGLWAVGISNIAFWTFIMFLTGLVPIIGTFAVWGPAGLYLIFIRSEPLAGAALLLYGATIVGVTDNIVRAKFVESRANIHPLLVLLGVIGGLPLFGFLGVVLGPLVLGFFVALLRVYSTDFWSNQ